MGLIDTAADILDEVSDDGTTRMDMNDPASDTVRSSARYMYSADPFQIRFEKRGKAWAAIETLIVSGGGENPGSHSASRVTGPFEFPIQYDGCPHCSNTGLFLCADCNNLTCWDGNTSLVVCPWCSAENPIGDGGIDSIEVTEDSTDESSYSTTNRGSRGDTTDSSSTSVTTDGSSRSGSSTSIRREK